MEKDPEGVQQVSAERQQTEPENTDERRLDTEATIEEMNRMRYGKSGTTHHLGNIVRRVASIRKTAPRHLPPDEPRREL